MVILGMLLGSFNVMRVLLEGVRKDSHSSNMVTVLSRSHSQGMVLTRWERIMSLIPI